LLHIAVGGLPASYSTERLISDVTEKYLAVDADTVDVAAVVSVSHLGARRVGELADGAQGVVLVLVDKGFAVHQFPL